MVWYFYQSQNKFRKRKERLNRKEIRKTLPVAQAEPAQPAHRAHQGQGGLLPPPAPPSCSVECHRASQGRHVVVDDLPGHPVPSSHAWRRRSSVRIHSPPPQASSSSVPPDSSPPEEHAGAPSSNRVASEAEKLQDGVQALRRRRLHRPAEGIEAEASVDVEFFLELPPAAVKEVVESAAVELPQPSPPSRLRSG